MGKKIGIRIDDSTLAKMNMVLETEQISKSTMVRDAINIWLNINMNKKYNPDSDFCVISLNILRTALQDVDEPTLIQMSQIAYDNHKLTLKKAINEYRKLENLSEKNGAEITRHQKVIGRVKNLVEYVYNQSGYKWFDEISYSTDKNQIQISGTHRLGNNFSRFIKFHLLNHMKEFQYQLEESRYETIERITEKINHVKFVFSPLIADLVNVKDLK